jgi:hypothetical protein
MARGQEAPLDEGARERITLLRTDRRYRALVTLIRGATTVGVAYCLYLSVNSIAGKTTVFSAVLSVLADLRISILVTLTLAGCGWGLIERMLRQRKTEYFQQRIRDLEKKIDPQRTTSGLTPKGKTNPQDKG